MTGEEWRDHLVRLAMGAVYGIGADLDSPEKVGLRAALRERMAQAAQAIVLDIEAARARPDEDAARMERIDATARAIFAESCARNGRIDVSGTYAYKAAVALEAAREDFLEGR